MTYDLEKTQVTCFNLQEEGLSGKVVT